MLKDLIIFNKEKNYSVYNTAWQKYPNRLSLFIVTNVLENDGL